MYGFVLSLNVLNPLFNSFDGHGFSWKLKSTVISTKNSSLRARSKSRLFAKCLNDDDAARDQSDIQHTQDNHISRRSFAQSSAYILTSSSILDSAFSRNHPAAFAAQTQDVLSLPKSYLSNLPIPEQLQAIAEKVKTFTLENGMRFVVLERSVSPTVSFVSYADVGAVDEEDGKTGIAHFLEHLAFKGTERVGSKDYGKERQILQKIEVLELKRTEILSDTHSKQALEQIQNEILNSEAQAEQLVNPNEFSKIIQKQGAVGLNAATSMDATQYFYNFPSDKLELWFGMESERFRSPVFRQFTKERDVVLEERRLRVDNSSIGKFLEEFSLTAFESHPYRRPVIGFEQDIRRLTRADLREFFQKHYTPSNLCFAIVGNVKAERVKELAETYFTGFSNTAPSANKIIPIEPEQKAQKDFSLKLGAEPWYAEGYHVPGINHPDSPSLQIASSVLSGGRTSRLYRELIEKQQVAITSFFGTGFPGDKYPNLGIFYALPAPGRSLNDLQKAGNQEMYKMTQNVRADEVERVKKSARSSVFKVFQSNESMASILAEFAVKTGDPLNAFRNIHALELVDEREVERVCGAIFRDKNRTIGRII